MVRWLIACLVMLGIATNLTVAQERDPAPPRPVPPIAVPPGGIGPGTVPGFPGGPPSPGKPEVYKDLIPVLIDALKDSDADVRTNAAAALAGIGRDAFEPMLDILKDKNEDKDLRANIVQVFAEMGSGAGEALPTLMKCLKDKSEDKEVRKRASFAIQKICKEQAGFAVGGFGGFGPMGGIAFPAGGAPSDPVIKPVDPGLVLPSKLKEK